MKSKTCLCNGTILKKDLTRFLPLMLAAVLLLSLIGWSYVELNDGWEWTLEYMEPVDIFLPFGAFMAFLSAVNLFGYLMKKGECDAMHALPLRRETLFFTHCIAAFIQFIIPFCILYAFLSGLRGWGFQMLFTFCAWLFFFGLTVFSMMLAGRKIAAVILCGLLHNLVNGLFTLADSLYIPLLPGLYLQRDLNTTLTPLGHMSAQDYAGAAFGELLLPLGLYALGGVALLAAALVLYRRRKLERAGDFLAERWLEPVFAWVLGIWAACFLVAVFTLLELELWIGLILGLAVGYFAARMFFARSAKVFGKKSLLSFTALVIVMAGSIVLVSMDPLGLVTRVPKTEQIESVSLYDSNGIYVELYEYDFYGSNGYTTADPEEIEQLRTMHQALLADNLQEVEGTQSYHNRFYLIYDLKNGSQVCRTYYVLGGEELNQVKYFLSQPEVLVGTADIEELLPSIRELEAFGVNGGTIHTERALLEIFLSECEAGLMYSPDPEEQSSWDLRFYHVDMGYQSVDIPLTAEKTIAWLEDHFSEQE